MPKLKKSELAAHEYDVRIFYVIRVPARTKKEAERSAKAFAMKVPGARSAVVDEAIMV